MTDHTTTAERHPHTFELHEAALERIFDESREIDRKLAEFRKRAVERALAAGECIPWEALPARIAGMLEACGFSGPERPAAVPAGAAPERRGPRQPVRRIKV